MVSKVGSQTVKFVASDDRPATAMTELLRQQQGLQLRALGIEERLTTVLSRLRGATPDEIKNSPEIVPSGLLAEMQTSLGHQSDVFDRIFAALDEFDKIV